MKRVLFYTIFITICYSFQGRSIDNPKLSLTAIIDGRRGNNLLLKVTLKNNTSDTVKYLSWICSWQDSYLIDNDKWKIFVERCFKNVPGTFSIPPYQSETKMLELERNIGFSKNKGSNFRIGFYYVPPPVQLKSIPVKLEKLKPSDVIIWSNTVSPNYFQNK